MDKLDDFQGWHNADRFILYSMKSIKVELATTDCEIYVKDQIISESNQALDLIVVKITHNLEYFSATSHLAVAALEKYIEVFALLLSSIFIKNTRFKVSLPDTNKRVFSLYERIASYLLWTFSLFNQFSRQKLMFDAFSLAAKIKLSNWTNSQEEKTQAILKLEFSIVIECLVFIRCFTEHKVHFYRVKGTHKNLILFAD